MARIRASGSPPFLGAQQPSATRTDAEVDEGCEDDHCGEEERNHGSRWQAADRGCIVHRIGTAAQSPVELGEELGHRLFHPAMVDQIFDPGFEERGKVAVGGANPLACQDSNVPVTPLFEEDGEHSGFAGEAPIVKDGLGESVDVREGVLPTGEDVDLQAIARFSVRDRVFDPLAAVAIEHGSIVGEGADWLREAGESETETHEKCGADYEL